MATFLHWFSIKLPDTSLIFTDIYLWSRVPVALKNWNLMVTVQSYERLCKGETFVFWKCQLLHFIICPCFAPGAVVINIKIHLAKMLQHKFNIVIHNVWKCNFSDLEEFLTTFDHLTQIQSIHHCLKRNYNCWFLSPFSSNIFATFGPLQKLKNTPGSKLLIKIHHFERKVPAHRQ